MSGNVGSDVDFTRGEQWCYARFRLACTPRIRRGDDWVDGETTWISVQCANRLAEHVLASIHKGDPVVVVGRLRTRSWLVEGERRYQQVVEATSVGHDLTRGTSVFTRRASSPGAAETAPSDESDAAAQANEPDAALHSVATTDAPMAEAVAA